MEMSVSGTNTFVCRATAEKSEKPNGSGYALSILGEPI